MARDMFMLYNKEIAQLLLRVGRRLESIRQVWERETELHAIPYPLPPLIEGDTVLQVVSIVESALVGMARDIKRNIEIPSLLIYVKRYLEIRKIKGEARGGGDRHPGEFHIVLSEAGLDALTTIEEFLKDKVEKKHLYPAPARKLNRKLVIIMALQHADQPAI